jgi:hypothetical protein
MCTCCTSFFFSLLMFYLFYNASTIVLWYIFSGCLVYLWSTFDYCLDYCQSQTEDKFVPLVCLASPAITFLISENSKTLLWGYVFDNELILINGLITFLGLLLISKSHNCYSKVRSSMNC